MKYKFIILLLFLQTSVFSQDYKLYSLFNNQFQAVFPGTPQCKVFQKLGIEMCQYGDSARHMSFNAQSQPYPFQYDVKLYNKKSLDETIVDGLKASKLTILGFESNLDKINNTYTYTANVKDIVENVVMYRSIKYIIHGKKVFRWAVSYVNPKDRWFFNKYQSQVKVMTNHFSNTIDTKTKQKQWTLKECKTAVQAFNQAANTIIIGKVQKGIRPTKTEACHIPNVIKAYMERCKKYDDPKRYKQIEEMYPSYKYACEQWVE